MDPFDGGIGIIEREGKRIGGIAEVSSDDAVRAGGDVAENKFSLTVIAGCNRG